MSNSREDLGYRQAPDQQAPDQQEMFGETAPPTADRIRFPAKIAELQRELLYRKSLYPRWIDAGKLKQARADIQIRTLEAIIEDYNVRVWPQTRKFVAEWREAAERVTFMGVRINQMHREELLAVVAYAKAALEGETK